MHFRGAMQQSICLACATSGFSRLRGGPPTVTLLSQWATCSMAISVLTPEQKETAAAPHARRLRGSLCGAPRAWDSLRRLCFRQLGVAWRGLSPHRPATSGGLRASKGVGQEAAGRGAQLSNPHWCAPVTLSQDSVASLTPFFCSVSYLRARRPISVVHTGVLRGAQGVSGGAASPHVAHSSRGQRAQVGGVGEQDRPLALDPLVPGNVAHRGLRLKVGHNVAQAQHAVAALLGVCRAARLQRKTQRPGSDSATGGSARTQLGVRVRAGGDVAAHGACRWQRSGPLWPAARLAPALGGAGSGTAAGAQGAARRAEKAASG